MKKIRLNKKHKTEKSKKWLLRHINDEYLQRSKKEGYRSRSAYKLKQINEKFKIFNDVKTVLDLGAAPGGWSQIASEFTEKNSIIVGVDKLLIKPLKNVYFIKTDINDNNFSEAISKYFSEKVDLIVSDMAPNTTGHAVADHLRIINLVELALSIANKYLKKSGFFVCKVFQGGAQGELLNKMNNNFREIKYFKPNASRRESSETYLIGKKK